MYFNADLAIAKGPNHAKAASGGGAPKSGGPPPVLSLGGVFGSNQRTESQANVFNTHNLFEVN